MKKFTDYGFIRLPRNVQAEAILGPADPMAASRPSSVHSSAPLAAAPVDWRHVPYDALPPPRPHQYWRFGPPTAIHRELAAQFLPAGAVGLMSRAREASQA